MTDGTPARSHTAEAVAHPGEGVVSAAHVVARQDQLCSQLPVNHVDGSAVGPAA